MQTRNVPLDLDVVDSGDNFHFPVDAVKDVEFLSIPMYRDETSTYGDPNSISLKDNAIQFTYEGLWSFLYKNEKPNQVEQELKTAKKITLGEWKELTK